MCENPNDEANEQFKEYPVVLVRDFPFPGPFLVPEDIEKVINFKPRDTDIFIVTYPKCGTTWSQYIVWEILNKGAIPPSPNEMMFKSIPFLEVTGIDEIEDIPPPRAMKTHFPFHLQPYNPSAKYIFVTRNPYDCCVSYYHHLQLDVLGPKPSFSEHVDLFIKGKIPYGDFFDHVLAWYKHRNDSNVLFLTYEDMKRNKRGMLKKIAEFMGKDYLENLQNEAVLENCLKYSDFKYMKELGMFFPDMSEHKHQKLDSDQIRNMMKELSSLDKRKGNTGKFREENFFRKGEIGDWKNHFSPEDIKKFNKYVIEKLKNTEMEGFWNLVEEETTL